MFTKRLLLLQTFIDENQIGIQMFPSLLCTTQLLPVRDIKGEVPWLSEPQSSQMLNIRETFETYFQNSFVAQAYKIILLSYISVVVVFQWNRAIKSYLYCVAQIFIQHFSSQNIQKHFASFGANLAISEINRTFDTEIFLWKQLSHHYPGI